MKKILLGSSLILAAISLSACSLLPNAKPNQEQVSSTAARSSEAKSSSSSAAKESSNKEDQDLADGFEELIDSGSSLSQLPDFQNNPDLKAIRDFHFAPSFMLKDEDGKPVYDVKTTSYEEVLTVLGQPSRPAESGDDEGKLADWETERGDFLIYFSNNTVSMLIYTYKDSQTSQDSHSSISEGMSAKQVFEKLGRPNLIFRSSSDVSYDFKNAAGEEFTIYIKDDQVTNIISPEEKKRLEADS